jgi:hypothetical protein
MVKQPDFFRKMPVWVCGLCCLVFAVGFSSAPAGENTITATKEASEINVLRGAAIHNLSTAPNYVSVRICNHETGEEAQIVCDSTRLFSIVLTEYPEQIKKDADYFAFIEKHKEKAIKVSEKTFKEEMRYNVAPLTVEMQKDKKLGKKHVINKYLVKRVAATDERTGQKYYSWFMKDQYYFNRSVMRLLLETGFELRRSCLAGIIYVEGVE